MGTFFDHARHAFAFLVDDLGYVVIEEHQEPRGEASITFVRDTTFVRMHVDPPAVWGVVGRFSAADERRVVESYGLRFLVRDACPDDEALLEPAPGETTLEHALERQATALRRHGADVLGGDFSRAPRLKRLRAAELRRQNQEQFGTATGETPRFSSRPTLAQLFSDATNDGLRTARAYQAVWDYAYSVAEVAAFLGTDDDAVGSLLDRWEGLD